MRPFASFVKPWNKLKWWLKRRREERRYLTEDQLKAYVFTAESFLRKGHNQQARNTLRYVLSYHPHMMQAWELWNKAIGRHEGTLQAWPDRMVCWCIYALRSFTEPWVRRTPLAARCWYMPWLMKLLECPSLRVRLWGHVALAFMARNAQDTILARWALVYVGYLVEDDQLRMSLKDALCVLRLYKTMRLSRSLETLAYQILDRYPYSAEAAEMLDESLRVLVPERKRY